MDGEHLQRGYRIIYDCFGQPVLRRLLESGQYLSIRYTERLAEAGIESSVGSVGDSYDNALVESIIGLFKTEIFWPQGPWKTTNDVEYAALTWVDWHNNKRLLEPTGNIPPEELEQAYCEQQEGQAMAA